MLLTNEIGDKEIEETKNQFGRLKVLARMGLTSYS